MQHILVVMPLEEEHRLMLAQALPGAEFRFRDDASCTAEDAAWADAVVGNISPRLLPAAKRLKLLQLNSAGSNPYLHLPDVCPGARLCCATGAYGLAISEHMLGMLLALMKKQALYRDNQFSGLWDDLGPVDGLCGASVLVVGLGDIGSSFARLCAAFGAHVRGVRRSHRAEKPDFVESVCTMESLDALLPEADVVFFALPETADTVGLMDARRFSLVRRGAYLLNCGRGSVLCQDALLQAVREGRLSGAGLDVTTPEPLPADHPLWQEKRVFITPHVSGQYHLRETHDRIVAIACENLRAMVSGAPLRSEVDFTAGY